MASPAISTALLDEPASRAIRTMGRAYLQHVLREAAPVEVPLDPSDSSVRHRLEVVHDFRVALRRLRSWLRLWDGVLEGSLHKATTRRLQRVARHAGRVRDLEALSQELLAPFVRRSATSRACARWMASSVAVEYDKALRTLSKRLLLELGPIASRLEDDLTLSMSGAGRSAQPTMRNALAATIGEQMRDLPGHIERRLASEVDLHDVRISLRRCRYTLDTLCLVSVDARSAAREASRLQDAIGRWRDVDVLLHRLNQMTDTGKYPSAPEEESITAMRVLLERRVATEYATVQTMLAGPGPRRLVEAGARVTASLTRASRGALTSSHRPLRPSGRSR